MTYQKAIGLAIVVMALVVMTLDGSAAEEQPSVDEQGFARFDSIQSLDRAVPFEVRSIPKNESEYTFESATVAAYDDVVFVDMYYQHSDGHKLLLSQSNSRVTVDYEDGTMTSTAVGDVEAVAINVQNVAGMPIGVLQWRLQGVDLILVSADVTATELTEIAVLIQ